MFTHCVCCAVCDVCMYVCQPTVCTVLHVTCVCTSAHCVRCAACTNMHPLVVRMYVCCTVCTVCTASPPPAQQLKSIISELKTRVVDLNLKLWEQEHVIRGEVCKEFHDQIVEIEDQHK